MVSRPVRKGFYPRINDARPECRVRGQRKNHDRAYPPAAVLEIIQEEAHRYEVSKTGPFARRIADHDRQGNSCNLLEPTKTLGNNQLQ